MSYYRVIPRDLFNEAKLLKCMGRLALLIHDRTCPDGLSIRETGESFDIELSDDECLYIINYPVTIREIRVRFHTTYNSKSPYPLCAYWKGVEYAVFDDSGNFTDEFKQFCNQIKKK